jgi:cellulose synthase/poly-beta-1,6-N-acetylglucosamine synthase-like glycosyltransferase
MSFTTIIDIAIIIASLNVLAYLLLILLLKKSPDNKVSKHWPSVSVLIPVRNEEHNLPGLLECISNLDYPQDRMEILIGDDSSEDGSGEQIRNWEMKLDHVKYVQILEERNGLKAKANVLAQLISHSTSQFLLVLDADTFVGGNWVKEMVGSFKENTGLVNGITRVRGKGFLASLQNIDWLFAQGKLKVLDQVKGSVTGIGNNMGMSRSSYEKSGGFENLPFSLTEDHALFTAMEQKALITIQKFCPDALGTTQAEESIARLISQRKRWMTGAFLIPFWIQLVLILEVMMGPLILLILLFNWQFGLLLYLTSLLVYWLFLTRIERLLMIKIQGIVLFVYPFYYTFIVTCSALLLILPLKISWKGRKY